MGCEIIMSGGWRQREIEICRKGTDQKKEGRDISVEGESETKGKVIFLYIVPLGRKKHQKDLGRKEMQLLCWTVTAVFCLPLGLCMYVILGVRKQAPHCQWKHPAGWDDGGWPQQVIPTQAEHADLYGCSDTGYKAAPTHIPKDFP